MAARACARAQRGKINTATTKVSVPSAAGEQAREDRNGVGGPESSRAPCFVLFFLFKIRRL